MSGEIPERVTCEVCGTSFDPRESRGWCPNTACGKWQHPAFPLSESAGREAADGGVNAPTKVCPSCGKDVRADANFCKFCSHEFPDEPAEPQEEDEPGLDACPDCGADLSSIPPDRLADCPICGTDLSGVLADQSEPDVTPADLTNCPACHTDLTNIPADMRMVCPDCRVDLQEAIRTHGVGDDGGAAAGEAAGGADGGGVAGDAEAAGGGTGASGGAGAAGGSGQQAGPGGADAGEAAESVDTIKGIGASYAERLADAGVETVGDLVRADLAELSAATDVSEKRLGEWVERAPVDPADLDGASESTGRHDQDAGGAGGQQAGGSGHASGQGDRAGAQPGGTAGSQQGAGTGGATGGQQAGARQGGTDGRQGGAGARQGGRASSGQSTDTGGDGGRAGGRNQPTVPGSSSGGQGQGRGGAQQPSYSTVVFEVMGQEIRANPGDTVGREIRTAMVEGGAPDDDAVYVHREHVRVECDGGTFYLVRLGQNSLKVNGAPVGQHERTPVASGDEVSFSEVVTATVRLE